MTEVDEVLAAARDGRGGGLLLTGEPGIGKSALLEYARGQAAGALVLSATGVEAETGLGYGVLQEMLTPVLELIEKLPAPQADALGTALGRRDGDQPDPFLVALGTLSLLSEAAATRPVLCLADDLQWADKPSLNVLSFAARRLAAEPVAVLASSRTERSIPGLHVSRMSGLDATAAAELLDKNIAPGVRDALVTAAAGNPLALIELPGALSPAQLAGRAPLPDPLPLPGELEHEFARRIAGLPAPAQAMALVCAAAGSAHLTTILRAAASLDVPAGALEALAGLIAADGTVATFAHPLVRSAAYYSAGPVERRAAHAALAAALTDDEDRRAWHLAAAASGPDEPAASALESAAGRSLRRSGYAAAADALDSAARLSVSPRDELRRLAAAADAAWHGGDLVRTAELLDRADRLMVNDPGTGFRLRYLRGLIELRAGVPADGLAILLPAAAEAIRTEPDFAVAMLTAAGECAFQAGDAVGARETARLIGEVAGEGDSPYMLLARLYKAVAPVNTGRPPLQLDAELEGLDRIEDPELLARCAGMATGLGAAGLARRLRLHAVSRARALGAAGTMPWVLRLQVMDELDRDQFAWAQAHATEALSLALETGQPNLACQHRAFLATVAAHRGEAETARQLVSEVLAEAAGRGLHGTAGLAKLATINLSLASGAFEEALSQLLALSDLATLRGIALHAVPDLVEAAVRAGRPSLAATRLPDFAAWARASGVPDALAAAARCQALLAASGAADVDGLFAEALRWHASGDRPLETARTALLYGEYLRRVRRRVDAREQLRRALDGFTELGAAAWAKRAAAELRATGATVPASSGPAASSLTAQEFQVAKLVAEGLTNSAAAAQLFISPRTVDHHLRNIYRKLGISSRTELTRHLAAS
jgi:DNA-binding CsgD family transcriptional regulator